MLLEEFCDLLAAVIPAVVLARVEHRPWRLFGLPGRQAFGKLFWIGAVWGFAGNQLLMFALYGTHSFSFGHIVLHGARLVRFAAFWALMFLLVGLFEEFLLRGYRSSHWRAASGSGRQPLVLSCAFGLIHLRNGGEQWRGLLAAAFIGFFFCVTLASHGQSVVRGRLSCGVGLGRNIFLFGARQRHGRSGTSAEFVDAWCGLAERRIGGTGRKCTLFRGDRSGVGRVRPGVSTSKFASSDSATATAACRAPNL